MKRDVYEWRLFFIEYEKRGYVAKMKVVYNVKYKFKENKTDDELKSIFNHKLLNVIMILENRGLAFKAS